jgi:hypothetical protein
MQKQKQMQIMMVELKNHMKQAILKIFGDAMTADFTHLCHATAKVEEGLKSTIPKKQKDSTDSEVEEELKGDSTSSDHQMAAGQLSKFLSLKMFAATLSSVQALGDMKSQKHAEIFLASFIWPPSGHMIEEYYYLYRKNLGGISREFLKNFIETACIDRRISKEFSNS